MTKGNVPEWKNEIYSEMEESKLKRESTHTDTDLHTLRAVIKAL